MLLLEVPVKKKPPKRKSAVALRYEPGRDSAPKITAKGQGSVAEKIIEIAREAGVPVKEQADLVEVLSRLDLYSEIPSETYVIVAQILAWVYELNKKAGS